MLNTWGLPRGLVAPTKVAYHYGGRIALKTYFSLLYLTAVFFIYSHPLTEVLNPDKEEPCTQLRTGT